MSGSDIVVECLNIADTFAVPLELAGPDIFEQPTSSVATTVPDRLTARFPRH